MMVIYKKKVLLILTKIYIYIYNFISKHGKSWIALNKIILEYKN
jgi:hypothetical protein